MCRLFVLFSLLSLILPVLSYLSPTGRNVCSKHQRYNIYQQKAFYRASYTSYKTKCRWYDWFGWFRCTKYRSRIVTYYNNVIVTRYKTIYYCCPGWRQSGNQCLNAICSSPCQHGTCDKPNHCSCAKGYTGPQCQYDIDECIGKPCHQQCSNFGGGYACGCRRGYVKSNADPIDPNCQDVDECRTNPCSCAVRSANCTAVCINRPGSFKCSCNRGFRLLNGRICKDVNECSSPSLHGCEHICYNREGHYICACRTGYAMAADGKHCTDINECGTLNGGCTHQCHNTIGSFLCSCRKGFSLQRDKLSCTDVDECVGDHSCDKDHGICENYPGGYRCGCKMGFVLQADNKTCTDLNECNSNTTNTCQQKCDNVPGTYSCSCFHGYRLSTDKRSCQDIDECETGENKCHHLCYNTIGSYICKCRIGYRKKNHQCIGLPCPTLSSPRNGAMVCSGFTTDHHCNFSCSDGFELSGSRNRTCQPSSIWSGTRSFCKLMTCEPLKPPSHAGVSVPCFDTYNATCFFRCLNGYYSQGSDHVKCGLDVTGKAVWQGDNITCKAIKTCLPNPCKNSGICTPVGKSKFNCKCDQTKFTGERCQFHRLLVPRFPRLTVGMTYRSLDFKAFPNKEVIVYFDAPNSVTVEPRSMTFTRYKTAEKIQVTALKEGVITIGLQIRGANRGTFLVPQGLQLFAKRGVDQMSTPYETLDFHYKTCHNVTINTCYKNKKVMLSSSCKWESQFSPGIISIRSGTISVPLSLNGVRIRQVNSNTAEEGIISSSYETKKYIDSGNVMECKQNQHCSALHFNSQLVNDLIQRKMFGNAFLDTWSSLNPFWVNAFVDKEDVSFSPSDIVAFYGTGSTITTKNFCQIDELIQDSYYVVYRPDLQMMIKFMSRTIYIPGGKKTCFVIGLCNTVTHLSLSGGTFLNLTQDAISLGVKNMTIAVRGFTLGTTKPDCIHLINNKTMCLRGSTNWVADWAQTFPDDSKINFGGNANVQFKDVNQATIQRFNVTHKIMLRGEFTWNVPFKLLGSVLTAKGTRIRGQAYVELGGLPSSCSLCQSRGVHLHITDNIKDAIGVGKYTVFQSNKSSMWLSFFTDIQGGMVRDIANKPGIVIRLRLFKLQSSTIAFLSKQIASHFRKQASVFQVRSREAFLSTDNLLSLLRFQSTPLRDIYTALYSLKRTANSFADVVRSVATLHGRTISSLRFNASLGIITRSLASLTSLRIVLNANPIVQKYNGKILSYYGKFCFKRMCFENTLTTLYDQQSVGGDVACQRLCKDSKDHLLRNGTILAVVQILKPTILATDVSMEKDSELLFYFSKESQLVDGTFKASLRLFKKQYLAKFTVDSNRLSYNVSNVSIYKGLVFNVTGSHPLSSMSWNVLTSRIIGQANQQSSFVKKLLSESEAYFKHIAKFSESRIRELKNRAVSKSRELIDYEKMVSKSLSLLLHSEKELVQTYTSYVQARVHENRTEREFLSYIPTIGKTFISRVTDEICGLQACNETCISVPQCGVCQEPVTVQTEVPKCEQSSKVVKASVVKVTNTLCEEQKYDFTTVYTGTCPKNPVISKVRRKLIETSLSKIGSAIGKLIAGPIGSLVGSFVGSLLSTAFDCYRSYEVHKSVSTIQKPCTKLFHAVEDQVHRYTTCSTQTKHVSTGFSQPTRCNCFASNCTFNVTDPECLVNNDKCLQLRLTFLNNTKEAPPKFVEVYKEFLQAQQQTNITLKKYKNAKRTRNFQLKASQRDKNLYQHKKYGVLLANASYQKALQTMNKERCILEYYQRKQSLAEHLQLVDVSVNTLQPLVDNVTIYFTFKGKSIKDHFSFSVAYEFLDINASISTTAKKMVEETFCRNKRRRRSITSDGRPDLPFNSWLNESPINSASIFDICFTFESGIAYLQSIMSALKSEIVKELYILKQADNARSILLRYTTNEISNASTSLLQEQNNEINQIFLQINQTESEGNISRVLSSWKSNAELYTFLRNSTVCFDVQDCINITMNMLFTLPVMEKSNHEKYLKNIEILKRNFREALAWTSKLGDLKMLCEGTLALISAINKSSLFCAKGPNTLMKEDTLLTTESKNVTLVCHVESALPVICGWKFNEQILTDENDRVLTFMASRENYGLYSCFCRSKAGQSISNGTNVIVEYKPSFVTQPEDTVDKHPSDPSVKASLICVANGRPKPSISWFYQNFNKTKVSEIFDARNMSLLTSSVNLPLLSGFYRCKAENRHGQILSKSIMLNVLNQELANQVMTINFTVQSGNLTDDSLKEMHMLAPKDYHQQLTFTKSKTGNETTVSAKLSVELNSKFNLSNETSAFESVLISRQELTNAAATIINNIVQSNSTIHTSAGYVYVVNTSFSAEFKGNICRSGYSIQKNNYACVQCPVGSYEKSNRCFLCPVGEYQSIPGKSKCVKCDAKKITSSTGSVSVSQCFYRDRCALKQHNCHPNATCRSANGIFTCSCRANFTGNGTVCVSLDHKLPSIKEQRRDEDTSVLAYIVVPVIIIIAAVAVIFLVILYRRRRTRTEAKEPNAVGKNNLSLAEQPKSHSSEGKDHCKAFENPVYGINFNGLDNEVE